MKGSPGKNYNRLRQGSDREQSKGNAYGATMNYQRSLYAYLCDMQEMNDDNYHTSSLYSYYVSC